MTPSHSRPLRQQLPLALGLVFSGMLPTALLGQASIQSWGTNYADLVSGTPTETGFTQVAGGADHSVALTTGGAIVSWGLSSQVPHDYGQVSDTPDNTGFIQVAAGSAHSLALRADGSIQGWGWDLTGQVSNAPGGPGFIQVSGGRLHSLALHADGSIVSWGSDSNGLVSATPTGPGFLQVAGGYSHSVALRADGSVVTWGWDAWGVVANSPTGTGFTQVAAGSHSCLALRADGSIIGWGWDGDGQISDIPNETGFTQIAAGYYHGMALRADGTIVAWGLDRGPFDYGQVNDAPGGSGFTLVAGGIYHSIALLGDHSGSSYCQGDGSGTTCPCGTDGNSGEGCANSNTTGGARLTGLGNAYVLNDSFHLSIDNVPNNKPGFILRGVNQVNGGLGNPVGDGLLCTSGLTARSQIQITFGKMTIFSDFQGSPFGASNYGAGIRTNYQFWYRDPSNPCSGLGFNSSNAWTATWLP